MGRELPIKYLGDAESLHVSRLNKLSTTLTRTPDVVPSKRCQDAVCAEPGIDAFLADVGNVSASWCNSWESRQGETLEADGAFS
jgi:hypothetical protein